MFSVVVHVLPCTQENAADLHSMGGGLLATNKWRSAFPSAKPPPKSNKNPSVNNHSNHWAGMDTQCVLCDVTECCTRFRFVTVVEGNGAYILCDGRCRNSARHVPRLSEHWSSQRACTNYAEIKVHSVPVQTLTVPWSRGFQIQRQYLHEVGKVVSPLHRPPLPPQKKCWYSFLLEAE
jgi:hypothetical protein